MGCQLASKLFGVASAHASLQVFLGTLREPEIERVNERISQAVMETCLAMTIFRDEFNTAFVAMFALLTFIKVSGAHCVLLQRCHQSC